MLGLIAHEGTSNEQFLHLKNTFVYPSPNSVSYYGALAIIETEQDYEFDKYEESPPCLEETFNDINNMEVFWQGFGLRIDFTQGELKDEKVLKLSNDACKQWIQHNSTQSRVFTRVVGTHLDRGITDEILCTGSFGEEIDHIAEFGESLQYIPLRGNTGDKKAAKVEMEPDLRREYFWV